MKPVRKRTRLEGWDYSTEGAYFLTLCAQNRKCLFSRIVGRGILDAPDVCLSRYGEYIQETLDYLSKNANGFQLHNWVIMPNHVHILLSLVPAESSQSGAPTMPHPTNATIPKFISSLKRFTNRKAGFVMWQTGYYDHIIRDEEDFLRRWQYIDNNPYAWLEDDYYAE